MRVEHEPLYVCAGMNDEAVSEAENGPLAMSPSSAGLHESLLVHPIGSTCRTFRPELCEALDPVYLIFKKLLMQPNKALLSAHSPFASPHAMLPS